MLLFFNSQTGDGFLYSQRYLSHNMAFNYCHKRTSFLPGPSQFPCAEMWKTAQGRLTNQVWSAMFRVRFKVESYQPGIYEDFFLRNLSTVIISVED